MINENPPRRVSPELLQGIIIARRAGKDMNDEIAVIEQDPFAMELAFDPQRPSVAGLEIGFDGLRDSGILAGRMAVQDEEEIGEGRGAAQVEHADVFGFFILSRLDGRFQRGRDASFVERLDFDGLLIHRSFSDLLWA